MISKVYSLLYEVQNTEGLQSIILPVQSRLNFFFRFEIISLLFNFFLSVLLVATNQLYWFWIFTASWVASQLIVLSGQCSFTINSNSLTYLFSVVFLVNNWSVHIETPLTTIPSDPFSPIFQSIVLPIFWIGIRYEKSKLAIDRYIRSSLSECFIMLLLFCGKLE